MMWSDRPSSKEALASSLLINETKKRKPRSQTGKPLVLLKPHEELLVLPEHDSLGLFRTQALHLNFPVDVATSTTDASLPSSLVIADTTVSCCIAPPAATTSPTKASTTPRMPPTGLQCGPR
eukprot:scaffold1954_cov268-Pinguiococcus_pyrenoidosus.AAC.121